MEGQRPLSALMKDTSGPRANEVLERKAKEHKVNFLLWAKASPVGMKLKGEGCAWCGCFASMYTIE